MKYHITEKYLKGLSGIEIGPSAHNNFELENCVTVGLEIAQFIQEELNQGASNPRELDIISDAHSIPLPNESQEYIFSSHVVEHMVNLWKAIEEWIRLLKVDGYLIIICPLRDATQYDAEKELTTWDHIKQDYLNDITIDTDNSGCSEYGHYHRFTSETLIKIINRISQDRIKLIEVEDPEKRIGNGFTVVYKKVIQ